LLKQQNSHKLPTINLDGYLISVGESALLQKFIIAEKIRDSFSGFSLIVDVLGGNFKNQFKRADKSGAKIAFILGEDEINTNSITIKYLRDSTKQQTTVHLEELAHVLMECK
jgi:histidyl-tRNA synthetase